MPHKLSYYEKISLRNKTPEEAERITNLFNDGLVNSENCDIVIANCANRKCNTFYTVFDGSKIVLAEKLNGRVPANIIVNTRFTISK